MTRLVCLIGVEVFEMNGSISRGGNFYQDDCHVLLGSLLKERICSLREQILSLNSSP